MIGHLQPRTFPHGICLAPKPLTPAPCGSGMSISYSSRHTSLVLFAGTYDNRAAHASAGGGCSRSSAISRRISWNIYRGMVTSAIWNATKRPWLTTFASILIGFHRRLVSDQRSTVFGSSNVAFESKPVV